jgi:4-hydroxybenzoate polyprenyltransferase
MTAAFRLLRVSHYIKNLFILLPVFFGVKITDVRVMVPVLAAAGLFCLAASAVYIFNDLLDVSEDRIHPLKKDRPLASGAVTPRLAIAMTAGLAAVSLAGSTWLQPKATPLILAYMVMNGLYSLALKHVALVDVTVIALGFLIRVFIGTRVSGVRPSIWIILMVFLLALFLALAKRREDVQIYLESGEKARQVIDGYSLEFLTMAMFAMAAVIIISYIMYTISPEILARTHGDKTYLTSVFVVLGVLRYLQLALVYNATGSPTLVLLKDRFLQTLVIGWLVSFWFLIYR